MTPLISGDNAFNNDANKCKFGGVIDALREKVVYFGGVK